MEFASSAVMPDASAHGNSEPVISSVWRPIHYLGSKLRALPALDEVISSVAPPGAPACDLFAGSGTVANWLAETRPVTAVDIQEYSRVICDALLSPVAIDVPSVCRELASKLEEARRRGVIFAAQPLIEFEEQAMARGAEGQLLPLASMLEAGSLVAFDPPGSANELIKACKDVRFRLAALPQLAGAPSMALRHFGGVYFSYRQAAELDVLLEYAHSAPVDYRSTLIAAILCTASDMVNTVGKHFAQPLRPRNKDGTIKRSLYSQVLRDREKLTATIFYQMLTRLSSDENRLFNNHSIRADYMDFIRSPSFDAAIVYADPPYTRDHYSRFYHVLETFALRDDPNVSTNTAHGNTRPSRGVYRADRHQSPFCIRSEAPAAFEALFKGVSNKAVPLVLSYSPFSSEKNAHPRVMSMGRIEELAKKYFRQVESVSIGTFFHSRLNRTDLNKDISYDAEYLVTCRP